MSADEAPWVIQLYALEHRDGRHMIHLTKEILGDETEGVLSGALPIAPAAATAVLASPNRGAPRGPPRVLRRTRRT